MKRSKVKLFHSFEELEADEIKTNSSSYSAKIAKESYRILHDFAMALRKSILKNDNSGQDNLPQASK